jgi:hypothetical protein
MHNESAHQKLSEDTFITRSAVLEFGGEVTLPGRWQKKP